MPGAAKNGVRVYQRIRRYINKIYLYGFFTRKDFAQMNDGSAKDYDAGVRLIKELFAETGFNKKRGLQSVSRYYHDSGNQRLQDSYMLAQLDPEDMAEYLHILNGVRVSPGNGNHIAQRLQLQPVPERAVGTVYNRLQLLHSCGYLQMRDNEYYPVQDSLDALPDSQLLALYEYVRFCSRTAYPRVVAGTLCRTIRRKLSGRGVRVDADMPFLLRHNTNFHVLDEELVYALSMYIAQHRWVRFDQRIRLPLVLRVDTQMGRWYALCADQTGNAVIERLSNVEFLTPEDRVEPPEDWESLRNMVKKAYCHVLFSGHNREPVTVCAKLEFEENPSLRNQFFREIRIGRIVNREGAAYYEAQVSDPAELKPLLRAYGAFLRILPGDHNLIDELHEQYSEMLAALEEGSV